jgi:hypothetical protein
MSDAYYYADPAFYDDSIWITCDRCPNEYDEAEYNSVTCSDCETYEQDMEGRKMAKYETPQAMANALWRLLPEVSDTDAIYDAVLYLEGIAKDER